MIISHCHDRCLCVLIKIIKVYVFRNIVQEEINVEDISLRYN